VRQTSATPVSYAAAAAQVVREDGVRGLLLRGLGTRLVANGVQASLFSVMWKYFQRQMEAADHAK
jgi:hypothetical protein